MKIELKKPKLKRKGSREETEQQAVSANFAVSDYSYGGSGAPGYAQTAADDFTVDVRNADASVKILDEESIKWWKKILAPGLAAEIGTGISLMSLFSLLLAAAYATTSIPFALAGVAVYLVLTYIGNLRSERIKYIAAAGVFAVLVATVIVLRNYIDGGIGSVLNQVYSVSEQEQAYIYDRFTIPSAAEEHPDMSIRLAVVWASMLAGVIASIPPATARKVIGVFAVCASMIVFAYYGVLPSSICLVVVTLALILLLAGGSLISTLPVLLASLLMFGAVTLISPGESYGISRMDENFRDLFALKSAYLETDEELQMPEESEMFDDIEMSDDINNESEIQNKGMTWLIVTIVAVLALAGIAYLIFSNYKKRRTRNRIGLDNPDPKKAITAMFPYGIKWLGAGDIDISGKAFEKLIPVVEHSISPEYADNFEDMFALWQEAAYSDHPMDEENRSSMQSFVDETIAAVSSNFKFKDKIRTALKYAL